jgi:Trypsin
MPNEPGRVIFKTDVYTIHENYSSTYFDNDIAIIQLPRSITRTRKNYNIPQVFDYLFCDST